jgi:hypothetical protein
MPIRRIAIILLGKIFVKGDLDPRECFLGVLIDLLYCEDQMVLECVLYCLGTFLLRRSVNENHLTLFEEQVTDQLRNLENEDLGNVSVLAGAVVEIVDKLQGQTKGTEWT